MILIRTKVGPSRIHGMGLFANQQILEGTPVWRLQTGFDRVLSPGDRRMLPELSREHVGFYGYVRTTDGYTVLSGDHACFMNHADKPNTGGPPGVLHPACTVALRNIEAGEELTCDYHAFDADADRKLGEPAAAG